MIDLDQNATTPLDPLVMEAMRPYWSRGGNAEARHQAGRAMRRAWDDAVETVARVLHADPSEIVFTSGGTEANNLALFGLAWSRGQDDRAHLVSSPLEHPAVAGPIDHLASLGWRVDRAIVSSEGMIDPEEMAGLIQSDTRFLTCILAHNEFGAIGPLGELAALARDRGVPVHTDAVQAVGRIPVDFRALGVATLAASAHKFHGPVGVGVLLVRRDTKLAPLMFGGGQQQGRRPGTPPVALAVGLARALELWEEDHEARTTRWRSLVGRLEDGIIKALGAERAVRIGPSEERFRLPQTLQIGFPNVDGDVLLMRLDQAGVLCSTGSACASGASRPSSSLVALGVPPDILRSSIRFGLGAKTTDEEINESCVIIRKVLSEFQVK